MSTPFRPIVPTTSLLRDPRSTGAPQAQRLSDIAGLKGTKKS